MRPAVASVRWARAQKCRAGFFGFSAPLPVLDCASRVRARQLAQLKVTLTWAARELGLPAPDLLSEVH